jgi:hypothetical protein
MSGNDEARLSHQQNSRIYTKSKRDSGDKKTVVLSLSGQRDNSFFIEEPPRSLPSDENLSFCFFHVEGTRYCALRVYKQQNIKGTKPL